MEIGKWGVLRAYPDYRDEMIDTLIKTPYDYPDWKQRLDKFKEIEFDSDYYRVIIN